jgi:MFS transporter, MHS family, alpha-ketoglutarate permease
MIDQHPTRNTAWRLKAIITGSAGNLVEWYDWYAYSTFALYFAPAFFPEGNPTVQLLNTAAIFAVGFLMRPIGGWLFGRIADRTGRKAAMTLSVLLMSLGSLMITFIPSYRSIGLLSPVFLLLARLLQGLSVGGEYGTSATYLSEIATKEKRGFFSSFQYVTLIGGQLVSLGIQLLLQKVFLTPEQLHSWGWRIPFFIGALLALVVLYMRRNMEESVKLDDKKTERGSVAVLLKNHPRAVLTVVGLTLGGTLAF